MSNANSDEKHDIFVSYARKDGGRLQPFIAALESEGWSVFWDRRVPPGETWRKFIGTRLSNATVVIVVWSRNSVQSDWVVSEAEYAHRRRALVPVSIDVAELPLGLDHVQSEDLVDWLARGGGKLSSGLLSAIDEKLARPKALEALEPTESHVNIGVRPASATEADPEVQSRATVVDDTSHAVPHERNQFPSTSAKQELLFKPEHAQPELPPGTVRTVDPKRTWLRTVFTGRTAALAVGAISMVAAIAPFTDVASTMDIPSFWVPKVNASTLYFDNCQLDAKGRVVGTAVISIPTTCSNVKAFIAEITENAHVTLVSSTLAQSESSSRDRQTARNTNQNSQGSAQIGEVGILGATGLNGYPSPSVEITVARLAGGLTVNLQGGVGGPGGNGGDGGPGGQGRQGAPSRGGDLSCDAPATGGGPGGDGGLGGPGGDGGEGGAGGKVTVYVTKWLGLHYSVQVSTMGGQGGTPGQGGRGGRGGAGGPTGDTKHRFCYHINYASPSGKVGFRGPDGQQGKRGDDGQITIALPDSVKTGRGILNIP